MAEPVLVACAGFLIGVLWMDLMFDGNAETDIAATAAYYHRAATTSQPRGALIAGVMVTLLAALGFEALFGRTPAWLSALSAVLAGGPIALALIRTVPAAVRLGRRGDSIAEQLLLARGIRRDHRVCLAGMSLFLALRLVAGLR